MNNMMKRLKTYFISLLLMGSVFLGISPALAAPELTPTELAWLAAHDGQVRLAHTPDWPPMDFIGADGKASGMVADYIRLIEKKLNFRFKQVPVNSWNEMLELARAGKVDVISAGQATESRQEFMNWSTPFLNLKTTIIVNKERSGSLSLAQMQGMTLGVVHQYAVGEFIRRAYPHLALVDVKSSLDGIRKVSFGELDAMITEVPNALYIIDSEKILNLRLAGDTGFELNHGMGIRKDWPIFSRIIEKALADISTLEHQVIYRRWVKLEAPDFYMTRTFWYSVAGAFAVAIFVFGAFLLWNMELKRQVLQRTRDLKRNEIGLEALLALNEHPHQSIRDIIEFSFRQMMQLTQSRFGYLSLEDQDGLIYVVDTRQSGHGHRFTVHDAARGFSRNTRGLWGDAVAQGKPIISNNYAASNPHLRGLPLDHCHIVRYMNVPIFDQDRVAVVAGMGNKAEDYTDADLRQLSLLAHGMWRLIQRKKAEQAMHQSEKRFQDLVEHSPNGIAIVLNNRVAYQNPRQLELIGDLNFLNPQEDPRFHREDRARVLAFYDQLKSGQLRRRDIQFRFYPTREDEESMAWVSCLATPLEFDGETGCLLIFIDMTESKKLEHLLTIQDKMASLGHVSAGIAHEIRNPLSGINIYLGIIHKHFRNPDKESKVEAAVGEARSASRKIDAVIKRVMNFAKPTEPRFETIDINAPVREAMSLTSYSLKKKGIELRDNLTDDLPACYAEPHLIEEVVLNLINNAVDAIAQGDAPGVITLSSWSAAHEIVVGVADNGPGVSGDLKKKIFDPFFTTKPHSTGIGLSICHRIITDHKGTISLGDAPGGGSCFMIQLPIPGSPKPTPSGTKEYHD